jgi:hypothetical protein
MTGSATTQRPYEQFPVLLIEFIVPRFLCENPGYEVRSNHDVRSPPQEQDLTEITVASSHPESLILDLPNVTPLAYVRFSSWGKECLRKTSSVRGNKCGKLISLCASLSLFTCPREVHVSPWNQFCCRDNETSTAWPCVMRVPTADGDERKTKEGDSQPFVNRSYPTLCLEWHCFNYSGYIALSATGRLTRWGGKIRKETMSYSR